jgi:hypothetical protein
MDERENYDGTAVGESAAVIREDPAASRFDPTRYLRQLRGRGQAGEYLDVKWRLLWLRTEHPDARIETEHVQIEPSMAIFKATVTLPTGGSATGYGSETPGDFGDYIEKAETKAIGRALNALGYGAQFVEPGDEEAAPAGRPEPGRAPLPRQTQSRPAAPAARQSRENEPARPIDLNASRERADAPASAAPAEEREVDPDAFTWAAFREWVTGIGLNSREEINELVGRDTTGMSPVELRDAILAVRAS